MKIVLPAILLVSFLLALTFTSHSFAQQSENERYEFADDLANKIDLKFNQKGDIKAFEFILSGRTYDNNNMQLSRLSVNNTSGAFTAFFYNFNSVIFLEFEVIGNDGNITIWEQSVAAPGIKYFFDGLVTKQVTENAGNDIAIMSIVESARILQELKNTQTKEQHQIIPLNKLKITIDEIENADRTLTDAQAKINNFLFLRDTIKYTHGPLDALKTHVLDMRESFVAANNTFHFSQNHHAVILDKINEKKAGEMHWEEYAKFKKLKKIHEQALSINEKSKKMIYDFAFGNDTDHTIWSVEKSYQTPEAIAEFRDWFERG